MPLFLFRSINATTEVLIVISEQFKYIINSYLRHRRDLTAKGYYKFISLKFIDKIARNIVGILSADELIFEICDIIKFTVLLWRYNKRKHS